ncbi:MAG: hypothetical protein KC478_14610 [Bacteriovoracaceae bacterium]|nr:hypothetical protein [Bacteriovoracaceae bacterium]
MKNLFYTLIATTLLSTSAFAAGVDHVSTDGAICADRSSGKAITTETQEISVDGTSVIGN